MAVGLQFLELMQDQAESWVIAAIGGTLSDVHGRERPERRRGTTDEVTPKSPNPIVASCVNLPCCGTASRGENMQDQENMETTLVTSASGRGYAENGPVMTHEHLVSTSPRSPGSWRWELGMAPQDSGDIKSVLGPPASPLWALSPRHCHRRWEGKAAFLSTFPVEMGWSYWHSSSMNSPP